MPVIEKSMVRRPLASRRVIVAVEVQRAPEPEASRSISSPPAGGAVMSKSMPAKTKRLPERTSSTITVPLRRPKPPSRWPSRPDFSMRSSQMPRRRKGESSGSGSVELTSAGGVWPPDFRGPAVLRDLGAKAAGGEGDLPVLADLQRDGGADEVDAADRGPAQDGQRIETERDARHGHDASAVGVVDDDVARLDLDLAGRVTDHDRRTDLHRAAVAELIGEGTGRSTA
jgi:hypothetical protein